MDLAELLVTVTQVVLEFLAGVVLDKAIVVAVAGQV